MDDWTGDGIGGEVVTTGPLYGRAAPLLDAPAVILWAAGEWVLVQSAPGQRMEQTAAWSHRYYLRAG